MRSKLSKFGHYWQRGGQAFTADLFILLVYLTIYAVLWQCWLCRIYTLFGGKAYQPDIKLVYFFY